MKSITFTLILICCFAIAQAQDKARVFRSEITPYMTRHEAEARKRTDNEFYMTFLPKPFTMEGGSVLSGQEVDIPYPWTDANVYIHLENVGSAYTLIINDSVVAEVEDHITAADFFISPNVKLGQNNITIKLRKSEAYKINEIVESSRRIAFEGSYLFAQNRRNIYDYTIELVPDSTQKFGVLNIDIIAQNSFNYDESISVGYDIYSPQGKLLDYNIVERVVEGNSTDTVRLSQYIYHTYDNKWGVGKAPLYKVMLFTKRDGANKEYMPLKIGFGKTEFIDGKLFRFGKELKLSKETYNATSDRKTTLAELKKIKARGKNTIAPDYPQPPYFYELCDELGLFVIDKANISASTDKDNRKVGGTPSNDPMLRDEYLERVKAMYYRSRNYTCVVAFELGSEAGNGYSMYKAYQWLKSVEESRPVIYVGADGEWNTDVIEGSPKESLLKI